MSTPRQDRIANRIISRLRQLAGQDAPLHEFAAAMHHPDDLRNYLRDHGWRRRDRAGVDGPEELWEPPWDGIGFQPLGVALASAIRRQLKENGLIAAGFGRLL